MLLCEYGSGNQVSHLLIFLHSFEGRTDSDLCFTESHISADQPVHYLGAFHISLHRIDGIQLVLRLIIREHLLKFLLPHAVSTVTVAVALHAFCIKIHQLLRNGIHCPLCLFPGVMPLLGSQLVKLRLLCILVRKERYLVEIRSRHIKERTVTILDLHVILTDILDLHLFYAAVDPYATVLIYHIVAYMQLRQIPQSLARTVFCFLFLNTLLPCTKDVRFCDDGKLKSRIGKAFLHMAVYRHNLPWFKGHISPFGIGTDHILIPQVIRQTLCS